MSSYPLRRSRPEAYLLTITYFDSSKQTYIVSFCVFSVLQCYILILSFYLVARAFSGSAGWSDLQSSSVAEFIGKFFTSNTGLIILALASTFGIYFVASFMYLDPWHMMHSFPQYVLMASSYTNILNVYAFCNWHDVSWGTKGSDKAEALPSAKTKTEGKAKVIDEPEKPQADIDQAFEETVKRALAPFVAEEEVETKSLDDSYKSFRTRLITAWIFSNCAVVAIFTSDNFDWLGSSSKIRTAWFFRFILLATAALSLFRFIGCVWVSQSFSLLNHYMKYVTVANIACIVSWKSVHYVLLHKALSSTSSRYQEKVYDFIFFTK
jgi:chitin synthase